MKTDAQIDQLLKNVAEAQQSLLSANDMILSYDAPLGSLILEHHQTGSGELQVRKLELGHCISY